MTATVILNRCKGASRACICRHLTVAKGRLGLATRSQNSNQSELGVEVQEAKQLTNRKCEPCEGGVDPCPLPFVREQLEKIPGWFITNEGQRIRKNWTVKDFMSGLAFFEKVAQLAEADGHHPDLHLEGYRNVWIELWTHAIGGLSENDFILAAKIDEIPVETV